MLNMVRSRLRSNHRLYQALRKLVSFYRRKRYGLKYIHPTCYIAKNSQVSKDLVAHEYSYIGPDCLIGPKVELGAYAMIGPRVSIVGGDHIYDKPGVPIIFSGRPEIPATIIERDSWIGCGAILIAGARIGRGAIVAAGAVVTRDVPDYEIYGGVPAKKIGDRFSESAARELHSQMLNEHPKEGEYCAHLE
jgi:acetyltransferase-like isoleucine patch superfamily enzyme